MLDKTCSCPECDERFEEAQAKWLSAYEAEMTTKAKYVKLQAESLRLRKTLELISQPKMSMSIQDIITLAEGVLEDSPQTLKLMSVILSAEDMKDAEDTYYDYCQLPNREDEVMTALSEYRVAALQNLCSAVEILNK